MEIARAMMARGIDSGTIADITGVNAAELAALMETRPQDDDA